MIQQQVHTITNPSTPRSIISLIEPLLGQNCVIWIILKKVVITYYGWWRWKGKHGDRNGILSLDVPASIINLLKEMQKQGYNLGGSIPKFRNLNWIKFNFGGNVGPWAPGELDKLVKTGNPILVPEKTYLSWFKELPLQRQEESDKILEN